MSVNTIRFASVLASLLAILGGDAQAQFLTGTGSCYCIRPVTQTYYQAVPVTEYRQVTRTVRRPVIETKYVDQPVTEYRPVTEVKTVQMPTVNYQTVTSYQTVQQPAGQWVTRFHQIPRVTPCQYDNRPALFGLINRTAFAIRQAFTPPVVASREYVSGMITQQIPITKTVALNPDQHTRNPRFGACTLRPGSPARRPHKPSSHHQREQPYPLRTWKPETRETPPRSRFPRVNQFCPWA